MWENDVRMFSLVYILRRCFALCFYSSLVGWTILLLVMLFYFSILAACAHFYVGERVWVNVFLRDIAKHGELKIIVPCRMLLTGNFNGIVRKLCVFPIIIIRCVSCCRVWMVWRVQTGRSLLWEVTFEFCIVSGPSTQKMQRGNIFTIATLAHRFCGLCTYKKLLKRNKKNQIPFFSSLSHTRTPKP